MSIVNQSVNKSDLLDLIKGFSTEVRIAAYRGLANSLLAKTIGAVRQHVREMQFKERNADRDLDEALSGDVRNEQDENARADEFSDENMASISGRPARVPSYLQASRLHAVFDFINSELETLTVFDRWNKAMTVEQQLDYMITNSRPLEEQFLTTLSDAARIDVKTLRQFHELQAQDDRRKLIEARPYIIDTVKGFGENGYEDAINELDTIDVHQLGVKLVEALSKGRDQLLMRMMRTRSLKDLALVPIFEDASKQATEFVHRYEHVHGDEISEALHAGRNIRTTDDLKK